MGIEQPLATATFPAGTCGIYAIRHTQTDRRYVGQSKNLRRRITRNEVGAC